MKLVFEEGERAGQALQLARPAMLIGRGADSDVVLAEQGISRQHARLEQDAQGWTVTDLGTTNGTFVNGRRIPSREPVPLQPGDRLQIGSSVLVLQRASQPRQAPAPAALVARNPLLAIGGAVLFLLVLAGVVALLVVVLQPGESTVPTPTQGNPIEQLITAVPVPTEIEGIVTSVVPLIPTEFHLFPPAATETPPPPAAGTQGDGERGHGQGGGQNGSGGSAGGGGGGGGGGQ
jgi:pSer/pThr/pTyr-binding forkhead associated (FHA) protein